MRRRLLKNVTVAYPGRLGVTTEKGQQNTYPLVLDAPTESYDVMLLRWQTGVFEVGATPPTPIPEPIVSYNVLTFDMKYMVTFDTQFLIYGDAQQ